MQATEVPSTVPPAARDAAPVAPAPSHRGITIALWSVLGATMLGVTAWMVVTRLMRPELPEELYTAPKFTLIDQHSRPVGSDDLRGRVWVAGFIFTNCAGICPRMTERMAELQKELPEDVHLVSFSVDPTNDTPEVLKAYAERHKANPTRWHFLTGDRERAMGVVKGFMLPFQDADPEKNSPILHSEKLILVDGDGKVRGLYESTKKEELDKLRTEAAVLAKWSGKSGWGGSGKP